MSPLESIENTSSVYDSCDPKYLRELREASGMDLVVLARTACLSLAQVRQLESESGGNLFYSLTIKRQAYKRLLMILGAEPPTVEVPEAFRHAHQVADAHLQTLDQIVAMSHLPSMQRSYRDVLRDAVDNLLSHKQVIGALLMFAVAVWLFLNFGQAQRHSPAVAVASAASTVLPAPTRAVVAPVPTTAALAPASASTAPAPLTSAAPTASSAKPMACAYTEDELPPLTSFAANKEGRYVYVVSTTDTEICLVDGSKKATSLPLKAGEGRSIYGASPWQISGANLQKIQIFFQGGRVSLPDATATRVKLIEVPVAR